MVIARTKLTIHDDLMKPREKSYIQYNGPNPEKFYREIPRLLTVIFKLHRYQLQEKKYEWHKKDGEEFKVEWEADKDLDTFSHYYIIIKFSGSSKDGHGSARLQIDGALRTEYPQETIWEKSLLFEFLRITWHKKHYNKKRDEYIKEGRRLLSLLVEELKRVSHSWSETE